MKRDLKILTYNVHGCVGGDRKLDPIRIADVIAASGADIVGLQELDVGRRRSGGVDQVAIIAAHLRMEALFHPAVHRAGEKYGDAVLTALPMKTIKTGALAGPGEPRGAVWVKIDVDGEPLFVFNTHLGVMRRERMAQLRTLMGDGWLGHPDCRDGNVVLMGDFNAILSSPAYRRIAGQLTPVRPKAARSNRPTFPARYPVLRLDHIFYSGRLRCLDAQVLSNRLARVASDHLPLRAHLEIG